MERSAGKRAKTMKGKGLVRQINVWMQPLHCLKQYLFKHFIYAKYLAVDFALKDWHVLYGFCEIHPFSPETSSWHLYWNSTIPVWQECVVSGLRNPSPGLTRNSDLNHPWLVLSSPQEQAVWILDLTLISWEHVVQPSVTHVERRQTTLNLNVSLFGQLSWVDI